MLEVRVARPDEFDAVLAFYTTMIDEMQGTDFDVQWQHGVHPSPAFLRESLEAAQLIVGLLPAEEVEVVSEGGESEPIIASAMVVNHEGAPGYNAVPWAVDAAPGRQLVNGAADIARAQGLVALRLDTFPHNVRGRGLYESCGFEDKGEWTVHYPALGDIQVAMYELAL